MYLITYIILCIHIYIYIYMFVCVAMLWPCAGHAARCLNPMWISWSPTWFDLFGFLRGSRYNTYGVLRSPTRRFPCSCIPNPTWI